MLQQAISVQFKSLLEIVKSAKLHNRVHLYWYALYETVLFIMVACLYRESTPLPLRRSQGNFKTQVPPEYECLAIHLVAIPRMSCIFETNAIALNVSIQQCCVSWR